MYGLKGVNVYPWPVGNSFELILQFFISNIEFYVNGLKPGEYTCDRDLLPELNSTATTLFTNFKEINFVSGLKYGSLPVCPFIFKGAQLVSLYFQSQVDSFLFTNLFRFNNLDASKRSINSTINQLRVFGYNYKIDTGLLHPLVFETLSVIYLFNTVGSIQTDLFEHFKQINEIVLILDRAGNFYHKIGIKWLLNLPINKGVVIEVDSGYSILTLLEDFKDYVYPDQDLCLFTQYPQNKSIYLLPYNYDAGAVFTLKCTITLKWLGRFSKNSSNQEFQTAYHTCFNKNYTNLNDSQIDDKIKLCNLTNASSMDILQPFSDYYETRLFSLFITELVPFVLIPCACLAGLFFNWKIIQTIEKHKKKKLKEDFYKYMSANADFNCLYCLVLVSYPINSCNWNSSYYFCSSIYTTQFAQLYKIVFIAYVGETVKMCANISYLMMTLNRYLLVGKDHAPWLIKIAKLEFKKVIRFSILFSAVINIGHWFEYGILTDVLFSPLKYNGFALTESYYQYYTSTDNSPLFRTFSDYPIPNYNPGFFIYSVVYFFINFVLLFLANTAIEVNIVRRMRKELLEKRARSAHLNAVSQRADEDEKKERRIIKMVVLNGVFNFFLRSPDLLIWLQYSVIREAMVVGFTWAEVSVLIPGFLSFLTDAGYFMFILTFISNFIIFYKFNTKFKEAVVLWHSKKLQRS
jgi:hypothetical protein